MRKATKIWLVTAAFLILIGCIIFAGVMSIIDWDFSKLSTVKYETNNYGIDEDFDGISIEADNADIVFALSDDGKCKAECYEEEKTKHTVSVRDGVLVIEENNDGSRYDRIGFNFDSPKITVYLPKTEYSFLIVKGESTAVILPDGLKFKNADVPVSKRRS